MQHLRAQSAARLVCMLVLAVLMALAAPGASAAGTQDLYGISMLPLDAGQIVSIGSQSAGKCSLYALRYARTLLDGKISSGSGMWSNGAVWSAAGYTGFSGSRAECLTKLYEELEAGRPVIVHLKNTTVSGVKKHQNRVTTYEYHLTGSGWNRVDYPHISTSDTYGHWVCVAGIDPAADPADLKESDFYALDPARVTAGGSLVVTRLLDGTLWADNAPLKILG